MDNLPDFSGKVLVLYITNAARPIEDGVVLEFAEFKTLENRLFITGRIPESSGDEWISNLQTAIAWDSIQSYLVFNSREDYMNRLPKGRTAARNWLYRLLNP